MSVFESRHSSMAAWRSERGQAMISMRSSSPESACGTSLNPVARKRWTVSSAKPTRGMEGVQELPVLGGLGDLLGELAAAGLLR